MLKDLFLKNIFAPVCILCGAPSVDLDICPGCRADLPWMQYVKNLDFPDAPYRVLSAFKYATPVDRLILDLKFHQRLVNSCVLGELFADYLFAQITTLPELIIPTPLHPTRLRNRGYNQVVELIRPFARRSGISILLSECQRVRATLPQTQLGMIERQINVENAFAINRDGYAKINGRRVAIVDDVITTGHTVREISRVVRQAGAREIEIWSVARVSFA